MNEQIRLVPGEDPEDIIRRAKDEHEPIRTYCLFSGGGDSLATAHRCRDHYDELVFIDTGTALPGVEDFVAEAAAWLEKPLKIMREDFDMYRLLILGGTHWNGQPQQPLGFPGPFQHGTIYSRLKLRQLERLTRESKKGQPRSARILALTGLRRAESTRRKGRPAINRKSSLVFANPLIDWTEADMARYKTEFSFPQSDVAALMHRSGECNCGCFTSEGEREMLRDLWPEWFEERIGGLEREAEAMGLPACQWGGGHRADLAKPEAEDSDDLCSSCESRQMKLEEAACRRRW